VYGVDEGYRRGNNPWRCRRRPPCRADAGRAASDRTRHAGSSPPGDRCGAVGVACRRASTGVSRGPTNHCDTRHPQTPTFANRRRGGRGHGREHSHQCGRGADRGGPGQRDLGSSSLNPILSEETSKQSKFVCCYNRNPEQDRNADCGARNRPRSAGAHPRRQRARAGRRPHPPRDGTRGDGLAHHRRRANRVQVAVRPVESRGLPAAADRSGTNSGHPVFQRTTGTGVDRERRPHPSGCRHDHQWAIPGRGDSTPHRGAGARSAAQQCRAPAAIAGRCASARARAGNPGDPCTIAGRSRRASCPHGPTNSRASSAGASGSADRSGGTSMSSTRVK
jgi:hypothetical protein